MRRQLAKHLGAASGGLAVAVLILLALLAGCGRHAEEAKDGEAKHEERATEGKPAAEENAGGDGEGEEKPHEPGVVVLDAEAQEHAGLATETLATVQRESQIEAVGMVQDAQGLSEAIEAREAARADVEKARAERDAAAAERDRLVKLRSDDRIASAREVEAAEARLRTAAAAVQSAAAAAAAREGALARRFGAALLARLKPGAVDLERLLRQDDLLVLATLPAGTKLPPAVTSARVETPAGTPAVARSITPARRTDPRLLGEGYDLVVGADATGLLPGMTSRVFLVTGAPTPALAVPEAAVVAWQGRDWIYVKEGDDRFVRHEVPPASGGLRFLPRDEEAKGAVVVRGAATLLSEELKGQIPGGGMSPQAARLPGHGGLLGTLVAFALRFRGVILSLAIAFFVYGMHTASRATYDVFPEFAPPEATIQTEAPGLSPEQVETLVTQRIENAINATPGIESFRSQSAQGLSVVNVMFDESTDVFRDRQLLAEPLAAIASELPRGVTPPAIVPLVSSTGDLLTVGLLSERLSLLELRTIADWTVKPRLLASPGVAKVAVFGGLVRQLQVQVDPERLLRHGLSIDDVIAAARRATGIVGAGFVENQNQRVVLEAEAGGLTAADLGRTIVLQSGGLPLTLADVATVTEAAAPAISSASVMGKPGVVLNLWAQYGANTKAASEDVEKALAELEPTLAKEGIRVYPALFRAASFIDTATGNIKISLALGAVLVVVVLVLFLFDLRTAFISCTAIPLSLLAAIVLLERLGMTLNTMTLGGLAIAIGEVVDDAVIDVENILRRLRQNRASAVPRPAIAVVYDASLEVRGAVVYATAAVALVFVPVLLLSGLAGRLFGPLGVAYVSSTLASLVVALTVTPALCLVLLAGRDLSHREPPVARFLRGRYERILEAVDAHSGLALATALVLTVLGLLLLPGLGGEFLPELREGHFLAHLTALPGTSLDESLRLGTQATAELLKLPAVRTVAQRVGRAEADDTFGPHSSELEIDLEPLSAAEAEHARDDVRGAIERIPGLTAEVETFLTERIAETLSGYTSAVVVRVFGDDLDLLDAKAREVAQALGRVEGATDVEVQSPPGAPALAVRLRRPDLVRYGLAPLDVLETVRAAYQGAVVGQVPEANRLVDVSVILAPEARRSASTVGGIRLRTPAGLHLRLDQVADVFARSTRYAILHEGARRVAVVTCNVEGLDLESFLRAARPAAERVLLPPGAYLEFAGAGEAQSRARSDLLFNGALAGLGVALLLWVALGRGRSLWLVLLNLPFSLVGGVVALKLTGGTLSIGSLVGFVTVFGITLRNSIMLVSHYGHLVCEEGLTWGREAAQQGASERLVPILMTSLVTGLGLLPLALGSTAPGREIEGPMAIVILGGLVTSTALNLLILPTLARRCGRFEQDAGSRDGR